MKRYCLSTSIAVLAALPFVPVMGAPAKTHPGQAPYKQHCAVCHGDKGKPVVPNSPDFSSKKYLQSVTDAKMIKATEAGTENMPGFKGQLKPAEIKAVVAYIRTLGK